ncbi:Glutathione S-transferase-like protein 16 [Elsinoe fawcettii]|nr:Glutathione S-transferase-like protein 16 [Elsinoe fawcettii]
MSAMKGDFIRSTSQFRSTIPSTDYPAKPGRYIIYANFLCPWAHRTLIVRALKGLEDIIDFIEVDSYAKVRGWIFSGEYGPSSDPITDAATLREFYEKVHPGSLQNGIASVPVLFDKKTNTIVNNESSEILRILTSGFDELLPEAKRENSKGSRSLLPVALEDDINEMNTWTYDAINNAPYKAGFASTQEAYEEAVPKFYAGLDRLDEHLSKHGPYLFGDHIAEADIRVFPTILRFDIGYSRFFTRRPGDVKLIRENHPNVDKWLRRLYWDDSEITSGAFRRTVDFQKMREGSTKVPGMDPTFEVPAVDILPPVA